MVYLKEDLNPEHVRWTKNVLDLLTIGGVWGIPRSGLVVTKTGDSSISISFPNQFGHSTHAAAALMNELDLVTKHSIAAGYDVTSEKE